MKIRFLFIYFLVFFTNILIAQDMTMPNITNYKIKDDQDFLQMEVSKLEFLEAKIDLYKDSFDRVNTTYQWAMGIIFTVIVAFLGITGYNYHKNYNNDLEKIKKELEKDYQNKINELLQKNSKSISDKSNDIENRLKKELIEVKFNFFEYQFKNESSERQKLALSLKILNLLSDSNWGYTDWRFNDYFNFIKDCCSRKVFFDHSEVDDVNEMLEKLPTRFENEKNKLISVIDYDK